MQIPRLLSAAAGRWMRSLHLLQIACVVLPFLLFIGLAWIDYRVEQERTREDVATTTGALAEHAQTVVETVELVLQRVLDRVDDQDLSTLAATPAIHDFLLGLTRALPQVEAVYLADAAGNITVSSRAYPMPRYDVHAAEYFARADQPDHAGPDHAGIVISAPFAGTKSGTDGFMISRQIVQDGKFAGVASVTVSQAYFEDFYRTILNFPAHSAAGVIRTDGVILVRFPLAPNMPPALPPSNPMLAAAREGRDFAVFNGRSDLDGNARIAGFRRLQNLPLLVGYSVHRSVFLSTWGVHVAVMGLCALLLSILLLATESLVRRKAVVEHEALRRLLEETERRRQAEAMAQQSQKLEALGRLTGGVAHDFNNLLAAIIGSLELALRRETNPRTIRLLQTASDAAKRGAKLTAQMLAFSRKQKVIVRSIDVNAVIRGMDDLLRRTLGSSVRLRYELADTLWPALADQVQLELALLNLAVNARDAMPNGGDLTFCTQDVTLPDDAEHAGLAAGDYVRVLIADTGMGMSESVLARAHEPFFTTKDPGRGTGLGLSMVYGFVRELGGGVSLDSTPGIGTSVSIFLRKADTVPAGTTPQPYAEKLPSRPGRILVIDDDAAVRQTARTMLEEQGHTVVEATGGAEALQLLARDRRFDLLIIDFAMPLMNGAQLVAEVTKLWPDAPALFLTGYVENDALRPWSNLGYATLRKPFSGDDLAVAVVQAMHRKVLAV
jgi:two-component system NtrC family sensor kinase